jgi:uncharacterized protein (TIGR03000 family)
MFRPSWKSLLLGVVVAVGISSAASNANAIWGHWATWGGYGCGYAPCCTVSCCDPCCAWPVGYRVGVVRPIGVYRSGWGGCCGSACCWDACGCESSCCGDVSVSTSMEIPTRAVAPTPPSNPPKAPTPAPGPATESKSTFAPSPLPPEGTGPAPTLPPSGFAPFEKGTEKAPGKDVTPESSLPGGPFVPPPAGKTDIFKGTMTMPVPENSGVLTIWVPYNAKVTINGLPTQSIGSKRQFVSHGLQAGLVYKYEIKASIPVGGQVVEDTKTVYLSGGQRDAVAFGFPQVKTEDAVVTNW